MCVKGRPSLYVVARGFSAAPGVKAEAHGEASLRLFPARTGNIAGNSGAPVPFDPLTLFWNPILMAASRL